MESTVAKGVLRCLGTAVGGILGFLVMFKPVLATRAVPLAAILCVLDLVAGIASTTVFRVGPSLSLPPPGRQRAGVRSRPIAPSGQAQ